MWCTKNDTRKLFPVDARSDKMTVWKNQSLGECSHRCLCLLCSCFSIDFSIDTMPQYPSNLQSVLVVVAAFDTRGPSWTWTRFVRSVIGQWTLLFLALRCLQQSPQYQYHYRPLATCWYLSSVCVLSGFRDISLHSMFLSIKCASWVIEFKRYHAIL